MTKDRPQKSLASQPDSPDKLPDLQPSPELNSNSDSIRIFSIDSLEACQRFAERFAFALETPMVVCLNGTLGAGKTQFTKFVAVALGALPEEVTSPTFVLVHRYPTKPIMYHLDAYRVNDEDEFLELGVEEFFEERAVTIIEWGEKFEHLLPCDCLRIQIEIQSETQRQFSLASCGPRSDKILSRL